MGCRPAESEEVFRAELAVDGQGPRPGGRYLRTGDLGFVSDGRVYLLGRRHDVITLGDGQMLYAQDVEYPAAEAWAAIRAGCVAAFATNQVGRRRESCDSSLFKSMCQLRHCRLHRDSCAPRLGSQ